MGGESQNVRVKRVCGDEGEHVRVRVCVVLWVW